MLAEKVLISRGGRDEVKVPVHTLIIPDARILSLCLDREDGNLLLWCHDQADFIYQRIRTRREDRKTEENVTLDVPDLWPVAKRFQRLDGEIVMSLWLTLHGLIQHFLPGTDGVPYGDEGVVRGVRYQGHGWFTKV